MAMLTKSQKLKPLAPLAYKNSASNDLPTGKLNFLLPNAYQDIKRQLSELFPANSLEQIRYLSNIQAVSTDHKQISSTICKPSDQLLQHCFENLCYANYLLNEIYSSFAKLDTEYDISPLTPFDLHKQISAIQSTVTKFIKLRDSNSYADLIKTIKEVFPGKEMLIPSTKSTTDIVAPIPLEKIKKLITPPSSTKQQVQSIPPRRFAIHACNSLSLKNIRHSHNAYINDYKSTSYCNYSEPAISINHEMHSKSNHTIKIIKQKCCHIFASHCEKQKEDSKAPLMQRSVIDDRSKEMENKDYEIRTLKFEVFSLQSIIESLKIDPTNAVIKSSDDTIEEALRKQLEMMKKGYEELKGTLVDKIKKLNADYLHNLRTNEREISLLKEQLQYSR